MPVSLSDWGKKSLERNKCLGHYSRKYGIIITIQNHNDSLYVTGFGKTCIVHTSDFAHLEIHKTTGNGIQK